MDASLFYCLARYHSQSILLQYSQPARPFHGIVFYQPEILQITKKEIHHESCYCLLNIKDILCISFFFIEGEISLEKME